MAAQLTCGRTTPGRGPAHRQSLRDLVEEIWRLDDRVRLFHRLFTEPSHSDDDLGYFRYYARPLAPARLPGGIRPFVTNIRAGDECYGGRHTLAGPGDPLLEPLWQTCIELKPSAACWHMLLRPLPVLDALIFELFLNRHQGTFAATLHLTYWPKAGVPDGIRRFVTALDLERYAQPGDLEPKVQEWPEQNFMVVLKDLPPAADLPRKVTDYLTGPEAAEATGFEDVNFLAMDSEPTYDALRPRLNAITRGWNYTERARYRKGFDPFTTPPDPPPGEEYRYPVADYIKKRAKAGEEPTIQIDVVHTADGSFLEFISGEGEKRVRHYAKLAEVELEMWKGSLADRWGTL